MCCTICLFSGFSCKLTVLTTGCAGCTDRWFSRKNGSIFPVHQHYCHAPFLYKSQMQQRCRSPIELLVGQVGSCKSAVHMDSVCRNLDQLLASVHNRNSEFPMGKTVWKMFFFTREIWLHLVLVSTQIVACTECFKARLHTVLPHIPSFRVAPNMHIVILKHTCAAV